MTYSRKKFLEDRAAFNDYKLRELNKMIAIADGVLIGFGTVLVGLFVLAAAAFFGLLSPS